MNQQVVGVVALAATLTLNGCAGGAPPRAAPETPAGQPAGERSPGDSGPVMAPGPGAPADAASASSAPPDLAATRFETSRVPVPSADAPSRGPADAPVTIQIFSDFECPFCALAAPVVRELEGEFGGRIRVVWRNLPLPMHPHAGLAAATALEVYAERGGAAFWRFHDGIFAAQRSGLTDERIEGLAKAEGVDPKRYHAALASHTHDARIEADVKAGDAAGVNGTPAFFVNSYFTIGVLPYAEMRAIVLQALKETGR